MQYLRYLSPKQVLTAVQQDAISQATLSGDLPQDLTSVPGLCLSVRQIENIKARMLAEQRLDKNDMLAVEKIVKQIEAIDGLLYYKPQVAYNKEIAEHLRIAICLPFQQKMLAAFGQAMIFIDAVFGLTVYGYPTLTLLVKDEYGHGCPVAYCVASAEDSDIWVEFVEAALKKAGIEDKKTHITFMMDKSKVTMHAVEDKIGGKVLLCIFHMLQEVDRFLRSAKSELCGDSNKAERKWVIQQLQLLQACPSSDLFKRQSMEFKSRLAAKHYDAVLKWYEDNWEPDAKYWVRFGRSHVAHLGDNTNNLIESSFKVLKYGHARGKVMRRLEDLLRLIVGTVIQTYFFDRYNRLSLPGNSKAESTDTAHDQAVSDLVKPANRMLQVTNAAIGEVFVKSFINATIHHTCVADCSCSCHLSKLDICKHLEAAASVSPIDEQMMSNAAEMLIEEGLITELQAEPGQTPLYEAQPLCYPKNCAPKGMIFSVDLNNRTCSCHLGRRYNVCCHLVAAAKLGNDVGCAELLEVFQADGIQIAKKKRFQPIAAMVEPTTAAQAEITAMNSIGNADVNESAASHPSINAVLLHLNAAKRHLKQLTPTAAENILPYVAAMTQQMQQLIPHAVDTRKGLQKRERQAAARLPSLLRDNDIDAHDAIEPAGGSQPEEQLAIQVEEQMPQLEASREHAIVAMEIDLLPSTSNATQDASLRRSGRSTKGQRLHQVQRGTHDKVHKPLNVSRRKKNTKFVKNASRGLKKTAGYFAH